jgi:hypothetical protein
MVPQYQPSQERASLDEESGANNLNSTSKAQPHILVSILLDDDDNTQDEMLLFIPMHVKIEVQGSLLMCIVMDHGVEVHGP